MLETFTVETFAGRLGESFRVRADGGAPLVLELIEATELGGGSGRPAAPAGGRVPFSVVFRGGVGPVLPQRTYRVEHDEIGAFDLFLVPIGPDGAGMRYEAVFA